MSVIVIGDVMIDIYYNSKIKRNAPEASNIPVYNIIDKHFILGGAANVALNLHKLESNVELLGIIGDDVSGKKIEELLEKSNIKCKLFVDKNRNTTQKNRIFFNDMLNVRFDVENDNDIPEYIETEILNYIYAKQDIHAIIISDYDKGILTDQLCKSVIAYANKNNILTFVDPKIKNYEKYKNCFLIKPNIFEAEKISNEKDMSKIINIIHDKIDCKHLLITLGEEGMTLSTSSEKYNSNSTTQYHTYKIENKSSSVTKKDVTGAGDVVLSVIVYVYMKKKNNLLEACNVANYIAGKSVGIIGNYTISPSDVDEYYKNFIHADTGENIDNNINKIIYDYEFDKIIELSNKKNIVFTNGCFDILHSGHIQCLKFAKSQGDVLVVGLNSDDSIKRIKGPTRPINDINERSTILSLFDFIDYIIIFSDDTPFNVLKLLKPLKMIKGSDYKIENIIGSEFVNEILLFDYINGKSSTNIIDKIKNT